MAPIIHLVRHAEGHHNVEENGEKIHDPFLTDKGKQQCQQLCDEFPHQKEVRNNERFDSEDPLTQNQIELLMASPLVRTIQTCQIGFEPAVKAGHKIILMPLAQENSDEPMDTGSGEKTITDIFGDLVDTHRLRMFPQWYTNDGEFSTDSNSLIERARKLRLALRERQEKHIAIVSHGTFAHYIVGNVDDEGGQDTRMWANAEYRSFEFVYPDDEEAMLQELDESKGRREDLEKKTTGLKFSVNGSRKESMGRSRN